MEYAVEIHPAAQIVARAMKSTGGPPDIFTSPQNVPMGQPGSFTITCLVYPRSRPNHLSLTAGFLSAQSS
jgi:hypothetical protein